MADREDVLFQAKLAEQAERYDGENNCYIVILLPCWNRDGGNHEESN